MDFNKLGKELHGEAVERHWVVDKGFRMQPEWVRLMFEIGMRLIGIILNKIQPIRQTDAVVIGSKTGKHVNTLANKGYNAYGLESSKDMILAAMKKYPNNKYVLGC